MNYSELLQLAKGWSNFIFYRTIIWRLLCCNPAKLKEEIHNYLLNPAELCCTMKKVYKNFIIGDKNVKKRKTQGAQARACEKR